MNQFPLKSFIPSGIVLESALIGDRHRLPWQHRFRGALLFSDIRGFTPLSERLARTGRGGIEEITTILNTLFDPAIHIIERWCGEIIHFSGDAFFVVFPGKMAVNCAWEAAREIERYIHERCDLETSIGRISPRMTSVVHYGQIWVNCLGRNERRILVLSGPSVMAIAHYESQSHSESIWLSPQARRQMRSERQGRTRTTLPAKIGDEELLKKYVAPHIVAIKDYFEGEYRQVVMVFLEIRGYGLKATNSFVFDLLVVLERYGGILVSSDLSPWGSRWLCAFGAIETHEDDADRAARACHDLLHAGRKSDRLRAGMHAGTVAAIWIGNDHRRSFELIGDVTNTAARVLGTADWGQLLVSDSLNRHLTRISTIPHGIFSLKGKAGQMKLHQVQDILGTMKSEGKQRTLFVGRKKELAQLENFLSAMMRGSGAAVAIMGEAGIGKSRISREIAHSAQAAGSKVYLGAAISFASMPYWLIGEILRDILHINAGDGPEQVKVKVRDKCAQLGLATTDLHHLSDIIGVADEDSPVRLLEVSKRHQNAMIAFTTFILALSDKTPLLLVFEDLHWSDKSSIETIHWLCSQVQSSRVLVLLLSRPGYEPLPQTTRLILEPMSPTTIEKFSETLLGPLPARLIDVFTTWTGGNPFYLEELILHLEETGSLTCDEERRWHLNDVNPDELPGSIELLIEDRLSRLTGEVRKVTQVCAVIGRQFMLKLLQQFTEIRSNLTRSLTELEESQLIHLFLLEPELEYRFRHALIRDVAYAGILMTRRRQLHKQLAEAIERLFPEEPARFAAVLGYHLETAGMDEKARFYYLLGARTAAAKFALPEAEELYQGFLRLAREQVQQKIEIKLELVDKVYSHLSEFLRAQKLLEETLREIQELGDLNLRGKALLHLGSVIFSQGNTTQALDHTEQALAIFEKTGDDHGTAAALRLLGKFYLRQGILDKATHYLDNALVLLQELKDYENYSYTLSNMGLVATGQGQYSKAYQLLAKALKCARKNILPAAELQAFSNFARLFYYEGKYSKAEKVYQRAEALSVKIGDRNNQAHVLINLASILHVSGKREKAEKYYNQALSLAALTRNAHHEGFIYGMLANLQFFKARFEQAQRLIQKALDIIRQTKDAENEAMFLLYSSIFERFIGQDLDLSITLAEQAAAIFRKIENHYYLIMALCAKGSTCFTKGEYRPEILEQIKNLANQMNFSPQSQVGKMVTHFEQVVNAFLNNEPLYFGILPDQLTPQQLAYAKQKYGDPQ